MKRFLAFLSLACLMGGLACTGSKPAVKVRNQPGAEEDKFSLAMESFRQASQVPHFRKAIDLLNPSPSFQKKIADSKGSPEAIAFLEKDVLLSRDEIQQAQSDKFNGVDVYYLEECFYFRDLVHHLDLKNFPPIDQIRLAWQWTTRHVPLLELRDPRLPAVYVIRQGFGSPEDRLVIFSTLLKQLGMPSALVGAKNAAEQTVLIRKDGSSWSLDPQTGIVAEKAKAEGVVRLLPNLPGLSHRMKALEQELKDQQDPVHLFDDMALSLQDWQAACPEARVEIGSSPLQPSEQDTSPLRRLARFLPSEDGGLDDGGREQRFRLKEFERQQIPFGYGLFQLARLQLLNEMPPAAQGQLFKFQEDLWRKFYQAPRENVLAFLPEPALKQLAKAAQILEDNDQNHPDSPALLREAEVFRERILEAVRALQIDANAKEKWNRVWGEDKYLNQLLYGEEDAVLEKEDDLKIKNRKESQKTLSRVLLATCRQPLAFQTFYLLARIGEEKAERWQALSESIRAQGKDAKILERKAQDAWSNVLSQWNLFLESGRVRPGQIAERLVGIQANLEANKQLGMDLMELLQRDLQLSWEAQLRKARAQTMRNDTAGAKKTLQNLREEIQAVRQSREIENLARARESQWSASTNAGIRHLGSRMGLVLRNWTPGGSIEILEGMAK